jgi:UDP-3-O-acyl-N-acetylglucosamine deacetylase
MPQRRTLVSQTVSINGRGLFTGEHTSVIIAPASAGGIRFQRRDLPGRPEVDALIANVAKDPTEAGLPAGFPARNTILVNRDEPGCSVLTVEHVLSALWALGVTDAIVAVDGPEVPIMDGGASEFVTNMLHVGLGNIGWVDPIELTREIAVEDGKGGRIVGETDEFGLNAIGEKYHMRDFHATILHALGLDQHKLFYLHNGRNEKLTDFGGTVIDKVFI